MSQKSNARKSQKGGVPYHEMKRGLDNWKRNASLANPLRKSRDKFTKKKTSSLSTSLPGTASGLPSPNPPAPRPFDAMQNKTNKPLVM